MPLFILRAVGTFCMGVLMLVFAAVMIPGVLSALPRYVVIGGILALAWIVVAYITEPRQ
jgi:hypothetical protein